MPLLFLQSTIVIAQGSLSNVREGVRKYESDDGAWMYMLGICAISLLATGGIAYLFKVRSERTTKDSSRLFRELCRASGLSWRQRRLAKRLSKTKHLADPCMMMLDHKLWSVEMCKTPVFRKAKTQKRLDRIQHILFTEQD